MSAATAEQPEAPKRLELRCPLLESSVEAFADDQRHVIVDLGVVRSGTVALFGEYRSRLDVAGLEVGLGQDLESLEADDFRRIVRSALPPTDHETVDMILCWNLFNYLSTDQIGIVVTELARRCRPGTRLHALIEYSARTMPAHPQSFSPASSGLLVADVVSGPQVAAPRYSARDLEKCMPGFAHERTMLLGNGMQEYLFRHRSG